MQTVSATDLLSLGGKSVRTVLISNPEAGRNRGRRSHQIESAARELELNGMLVDVVETARAGDGAVLAHSALKNGAELIVVCGGDGTINEVVGGMAHSPVPLAILPGGTANVLARELGLPLEISAAARAISSSTPRRVALGQVGNRYFVLMAGVGFDARVVRGVDGRWKKLFGMTTYVMEALRQLFWFGAPVPFLLSADGQRQIATFACISKSQFYGPIRMVREADLFSDHFHTYCFHSANPLRYFLYALAVLAGKPAQLSDFSQFRSKKIHCEQIGANGKKIFLQVDGEFAGQLPCTIEIVPDALTLLVPSPSGNGHGVLPRAR